jgi:hypothetical protein
MLVSMTVARRIYNIFSTVFAEVNYRFLEMTFSIVFLHPLTVAFLGTKPMFRLITIASAERALFSAYLAYYHFPNLRILLSLLVASYSAILYLVRVLWSNELETLLVAHRTFEIHERHPSPLLPFFYVMYNSSVTETKPSFHKIRMCVATRL